MHRSLVAVLSLVAVACGPQVAHVVMNADNNSGQSGTATITAKDKGIHVDFTIGADPTDSAPQLAHIHHGRCGELLAVEFPLSDAGVGADPEHFVSSTDVAAAFSYVTDGAHCINVHSHSDTFLYVSCGNIE